MLHLYPCSVKYLVYAYTHTSQGFLSEMILHLVSDGHFKNTLSSSMLISSVEKEQRFEKFSFTYASSTYHVLM